MKKTVKAVVPPEGENFAVQLPFDASEVFGRARAPVVITVGGHSFRWTTAVYGGKSFIGIRKSHRQAAGLVPGKTVTITIEPDDAPRTIEPPPDLAKALEKSAKARAAWDALSFTHKREHVEAILDAKKPETRVRRIEKTLAMLTR